MLCKSPAGSVPFQRLVQYEGLPTYHQMMAYWPYEYAYMALCVLRYNMRTHSFICVRPIETVPFVGIIVLFVSAIDIHIICAHNRVACVCVCVCARHILREIFTAASGLLHQTHSRKKKH